MGLDAMILDFWMLSFKPTFSLSSLTLIKRLFSVSLLSAIRKVVSFAYLSLLIFFLAVLILACNLSTAFHMIGNTCTPMVDSCWCVAKPIQYCKVKKKKLNKQGDNIQPWHSLFPIWNPSIVPYPVLTVASWPAYRFLRRRVKWFDIPISRIFHSLLWSTQSKAFA